MRYRTELSRDRRSNWEVYYGGHDTAADGVPTSAVWDNPIDDDGAKFLERGGGFRLNTPKPGILSVDRSFEDGRRGPTHLPRDRVSW